MPGGVNQVMLGAALIAGVAGALASTASAAPICAPRKISATGAVAPLALFARINARSAWSRKVTADSQLGARYATWLASRERRTVCRRVEARHLCLAVATPCRGSIFSRSAAAHFAMTRPL